MSKTVKARFTTEERDIIIEHQICMNPRVAERIREKRSRNGYVSIELNKEELADLAGCVASEANHTKKRELGVILNEICDQLESLEDKFRNPIQWH
jgi:hypothetical protein